MQEVWDERKIQSRNSKQASTSKHHASSSYRKIRVELAPSSLFSERKINTCADPSPVAYHSQKGEFPWISKDSTVGSTTNGRGTRLFLTFVNTTGSAYAAKALCMRPTGKYLFKEKTSFQRGFSSREKAR